MNTLHFLIRPKEKKRVTQSEAIARLELLAAYGRFKQPVTDDAKTGLKC